MQGQDMKNCLVPIFGATGRSSAFSLKRGKNHTSYREWHVLNYCGNMPKPHRQIKNQKNKSGSAGIAGT
jgi:hypothetical protein